VRRIALLYVVLAMAHLPAAPAGAQPGPTISSEELLGRLSAAAVLAEEGAADPSPARMRQVEEAMGLPTVVRIDGVDVAVPPDPVVMSLTGARAEDFRRAADRIGALRDSLERATTAAPVDADEVESALTEAYRGVLQVDPGLIERIRRAIGELIQSLLARLFSFQGAGTIVAWAVLVGLGMLAFWLIRRLRLVGETTMEVAGGRTGRPRVDWIARAEDAVRAGDLHLAIHAFYRGLLGALSGRGLLIDAPGLTAGECRSTVRAVRPELFDAVADATSAFEQIAYGGAVPEPDDVDTLRRAVVMARST
jgi:HAMP domain-containing protein